MKARWILPVCVSLAALVAVTASPPPSVSARDNIVGTWRLAVSHEVLGDFFTLMVFDKRNTMTDNFTLSAGNSLGSGVWEKIGGDDTYAVTFEAWNDDDLDGTYDTRSQIRLTLQVDDDTLTGTGTVDIFSLDGTVLFVSLPGFIFEGTRMTVIPE